MCRVRAVNHADLFAERSRRPASRDFADTIHKQLKMYSRAIRFAALALLSATAAGEDSNTCASTETPPVLRYFDIRGRAEPIRLALSDYGVAFEDASFSFDEWGKDKDDGFKATWTASGKIAFGQVPAMEGARAVSSIPRTLSCRLALACSLCFLLTQTSVNRHHSPQLTG